jgi:hypothetical protein
MEGRTEKRIRSLLIEVSRRKRFKKFLQREAK